MVILGLVQRSMDSLESIEMEIGELLMDQISCLHLPVTKAQIGLTSAQLGSLEERGSSGRINSIREKHDSVESKCEELRSASTLRSRKLVPFFSAPETDQHHSGLPGRKSGVIGNLKVATRSSNSQ